MTGVFDHLHIKRHTVGSSNELSFDVLDAARTDLDVKSSRSSRISNSSLSKRGSYHGVKGTATLSGQAEVERRKRNRKLQSYAFWTVAALVVLVAACAILWFGYSHYLEVQDFTTRYDSLVNQFAEEDAFIAEMDGLMAEPIDNSTSQARKDALGEIPGMIESMERIKANAESAKPLALGTRDEQAVDKVIESADARIEMLKVAESSLTLSGEIDAKASKVNALWNDIVDSAQSARAASMQANEATTEEMTEEALEQTKQALADMKNAQEKIVDLEASDKVIDLSPQRTYLEEKVKSLEYAVSTGEALLEGDREKAEEMNALYNESDRRSAELAKNMPLSPEESIYQAYASQLEAYAQEYDERRDKVASIDAEVRTYLKDR